MNIPTENTTGDGQSDLILTNGNSDHGSRRLLQHNVKGSPPTGVSQCNVTLSTWSQRRDQEPRPFGPGEPNRKFIECKAPMSTARKCVFCKDSGSPLMRTDVTRVFLAMMVVILTVAMVHAHMKLWRMEERLAEMENQRSGNNGKFLMFNDKLDGKDSSQNIPSLNFPDQSNEADLMAIGDVEEGSVRKRRDATNLKKKTGKTKDKPKNNKRCNNKNLIDQYCFDKIEGLQPIYNEFEGVFGNKYPFTLFQNAVGECYGPDRKNSKHPKVCRDNTVHYAHAESPLAFYVPVKRSNTTFLNITSEENGEFTAQESGIFLLQFSIVMIDKHQKQSIGVFVDDTPVMACPPGGYQKPKSLTNHRLCSFNGILHMVKDSKLQLKTMYNDTTVRIERKDKSIIKLTLLHRLSREFKTQ